MESGTFEWCWICACLQSLQTFNWLQSKCPSVRRWGLTDLRITAALQLYLCVNLSAPHVFILLSIKLEKKKKPLSYYTKKENVPSAFPANRDISCSSVLKLLRIWKKTVSPMEILSSPLVVIPIKHKKKKNKKTQQIIGTDGQNM